MTNKIRHPEKVNKPVNPIKKKPDWIRSKLSNSKEFFLTKTVVNQNNLVTVCQEANCPNITECWSKRHATFMIMGDTCTRACAFCDVKTGKPESLDPFEPSKISNAVNKLNLKHVVITSVDRDDLEDGGSEHFYNVITATRKKNPNTSIEVLTPDFLFYLHVHCFRLCAGKRHLCLFGRNIGPFIRKQHYNYYSYLIMTD